METVFDNKIIQPYFCSCDGVVTFVNKKFIEFIGFTVNELLGTSLKEIGDILKINSQILLDNITGTNCNNKLN